ncbi:MAG: hypothetical protein COB35_10270 [Gammaproteobacteria bacterium]|nr:MAG: hypothetical protein COB35_10270 [Gammaproteobacteria bacterium]
MKTEPQNQPLQLEWLALHRDNEKYEHYSLLIKLTTITLTFIGIIMQQPALLIINFIFILWLQDSIWKTYQGRTSERILLLEQAIIDDKQSTTAFSFYRQWQEKRPNIFNLVLEYIKSSMRPTVAYPYVALIILTLITP